jgi:hypothetical protein
VAISSSNLRFITGKKSLIIGSSFMYFIISLSSELRFSFNSLPRVSTTAVLSPVFALPLILQHRNKIVRKRLTYAESPQQG